MRDALRMLRRGDPGLLGALLWWAGDIAVLWACFDAFGAPPEPAVIVVAYFVGMLANTLPLPGGIGGVDGGMIGALIAFGVDPSLAVVVRRWPTAASPSGCRSSPGVAAWVSLRRTVAGWDAEPLPAAAAGPEAPAALPEAPAAPRRTGAPVAHPRPAYVPVAA